MTPPDNLLAEARNPEADAARIDELRIYVARLSEINSGLCKDYNNLLVAHSRCSRDLDAATQRNERLAAALEALEDAEARYRLVHDLHGDGSKEAGRAWDLMRRAGDKARTALNEANPHG